MLVDRRDLSSGLRQRQVVQEDEVLLAGLRLLQRLGQVLHLAAARRRMLVGGPRVAHDERLAIRRRLAFHESAHRQLLAARRWSSALCQMVDEPDPHPTDSRGLAAHLEANRVNTCFGHQGAQFPALCAHKIHVARVSEDSAQKSVTSITQNLGCHVFSDLRVIAVNDPLCESLESKLIYGPAPLKIRPLPLEGVAQYYSSDAMKEVDKVH
mmetsp:Transcript_129379/g.360358  ORF Transcript_129379/g.360358 Transcript_129379/m.360358 type:complete len:211 (-) Transcript_129379:709-1341(-)